MKKILLTLAAAFIMSATAFAQGGFGGGQFDPEQMIKMRTDRTVEQYKLNAEQAKQLLELNTKYNDRLMGGFGRMGGGRRGGGGMGQGGPGGGFGQGGQMPQLTDEQRAQMEEARKKREEAQKEYDAELEKIMTPEQFKQYQEDQKNRRQRGGGFGGGQRGPRPQGQPNI